MGLVPAFFGRRQRPEVTFTPSANSTFLELVGLSSSSDTPTVTHEQALGVPAVWCAINFLASTVAGIPLRVYTENGQGQKTLVKRSASNPVVDLLQNAINDEETSFQWRFDMMVDIMTHGRSTTYIERDGRGRVINLFPLERPTVERRKDGTRWYRQTSSGVNHAYPAKDVIDITFLRNADRVSTRSPLTQCAIAIAKAHEANKCGVKEYSAGGLPAMVLTGPIVSGDAAKRASADIAKATQQLAKDGRNILALPEGHKLESLSRAPAQMQLMEAQEFSVQEVSRIFGLAPNFLMDLSRSTYSNIEEQSLNLVKFTLRRWCEVIEAELRLKLFGRNSNRFAEFDLDRLMRGDLVSRTAANAQAINTGQMTINEVRNRDSRAPVEDGDTVLVQGAMVSLEKAIAQTPAPIVGAPTAPSEAGADKKTDDLDTVST